MVKKIGIKLHYDDREETFESLNMCAKEYKISIATIKKIALGEIKRLNPFGENCQIILEATPNFIDEEKDKLFHCDICDLNVLKTSMTNHLHSMKHQYKKVLKTKEIPQ